MNSRPIFIASHHRVVVLTGAGISAESGIRTFRDAGGLWENHRIEEVASPEGWAADPGNVWRFYSARRAQARECVPNAAHRALADLESKLGERLELITQNVDDLHERGGSNRVLHMHGQLELSRCEDTACRTQPFLDSRLYFSTEHIARCTCGARIRPHIVWFGEEPFEMRRIKAAVLRCDLFVVVGTSGAVYPAAGLVNLITSRRHDGSTAKAIYVGPEPPLNASSFQEIRLGTACEIVPTLFDCRRSLRDRNGPYESFTE
ncbi:MAG: NAD-dependent deacylase [Pirellulaceae bacterium]|nr:NAD-dependent deacylase [Pirellulaceae bacterium]